MFSVAFYFLSIALLLCIVEYFAVFMIVYLFKKLWDRPKGGPSSRSTGNIVHCCHETGEYRTMRNVPSTPHYRTVVLVNCLLERWAFSEFNLLN